MEIKNLDKFRGKMKWTTVTDNGRVTISIGSKKYTGTISYCDTYGYLVAMTDGTNDALFNLAGVEKISFMESVLGYKSMDGVWPWMRSTDDILKVLIELDKLYTTKESEHKIEKPKSMEMEHPSIADIDFTPKKKHYSFNFQI